MLKDFSLYIDKAWFNKSTNQRQWKMVGSDTSIDHYDDSMSLELFQSFMSRIASKEPPPEQYRSTFWEGGIPYLSISHYSDQNGKGVPGDVERVYIDGNRLKAKGDFFDNSLGHVIFEEILKDKNGTSEFENQIRVSIAFLDWKHLHMESGVEFTRKSVEDSCPECSENFLKGILGGRQFLDGHLVHLAFTRVPANENTHVEVNKSMTTKQDDAKSIIGEELADDLETNEKMVAKSDPVSPIIVKAKKDEEEEDSEDSVEEDDEKDSKRKKKKKEEEKSIVDRGPSTGGYLTEETFKSLLGEYFEQPGEKIEINETHPLDSVLTSLKDKFDTVRSLDIPTNEKLMDIQKEYEDIGQAIQSKMTPETVEPVVEDTGNLLEQLKSVVQEAIAPAFDEIALLKAQAESRPRTQSPVIPKPRSLSAKALTEPAQPKVKLSQLSRMANKSVGLAEDHVRPGVTSSEAE